MAKAKIRASEKPQDCNWCSQPATKSFLWAEGKAYIPACDAHHQKTIEHLAETYDKPDAVHTVRKSAGQTVRYIHNPGSSTAHGDFGEQFAQHVEPAGRYLTEQHRDHVPDGWESGEVHFSNPLHLNWGGDYRDPSNWKHELSRQYDGRTGHELSRAVADAGHDGIITHDRYGTNEIVDLTHLHKQSSREPGSVDCWVCRGIGDEPGPEEGHECRACDGSGYMTPGEQKRWTCPCGMQVTIDEHGEYAHRDGSVSHDKGDGVPKDENGHYQGVADVMRDRDAHDLARKRQVFGAARQFTTEHMDHGESGSIFADHEGREVGRVRFDHTSDGVRYDPPSGRSDVREHLTRALHDVHPNAQPHLPFHGIQQHVAWVRTEHLKAYRENDRTAEAAEDNPDHFVQKRTMTSLNESLGTGEPIHQPLSLAYDPKRGKARLTDGNHRLASAEENGHTHVPVVGYVTRDRIVKRPKIRNMPAQTVKRTSEVGDDERNGPAKRQSLPNHEERDYINPDEFLPRHVDRIRHTDGFDGRTALLAYRPTRRIFGPTFGLDHRLFTGDKLRPDIARYVLSTLGAFWEPLYGPEWRSWSIAYLAGSEASEWTSATLEGNNDFDVLVGVDYDAARAAVPAFDRMTDDEITHELNQGFRAGLMPHTQPVWVPVRMLDVERSGAWHPDQLSHQSDGSNSSASTSRTSGRRPILPESTGSASRPSAGTWTPPVSPGSWVDADPDGIPLARSAGHAGSPPPTLRTALAGSASPSTCGTTTSAPRTGSPRSASTNCSPSRAADAAGAAGTTSSSSSTTTTGAAPGSGRAASAFEASSARGTTRPSPTSVSPIWAPQSSGLTAESLPSLPDGWTWVGPLDNTFYVNPNSYHIADIKPYAAYDVTHDTWAVKPPHLPDWSIEDFPAGKGLVEMGDAYDDLIKAIMKMPEPYRTQQGNALWEHLHSDRGRAFGPDGEGWYDPANVIEKWLDAEGVWKDLWELHHRAEEDPTTLLAPADWSNDPRTMKVN